MSTPSPDGNPYLRATPEADARQAELDASAPVLRPSDLQRLNRKALVFLAGIVSLLLLAAFWMFDRARSGREGTPRIRDEAVVIPDLPRVPNTPGPASPGPLPDVAPVSLAPANGEALPPLPQPMPHPVQAAPTPPRAPSLLERRISADGSNSIVAGGPPSSDPYLQAMQAMQAMQAVGMASAPAAKTEADTAPARAPVVARARRIGDRDTLLVRGTYLRCVLETRIVTDIPGFTSCVVTEPIYSMTGRRLLLAKGSKLSGSYDSEANGPRIAVVWDRITTPDGIDVAMHSPGIDNLGGAGHPGDYNAHWASRVSSALLISLLSDAFKYAGETNGPTSTTVTNGIVTQEPFQSNTAQTLQRLANQGVDHSMRRPATVTINQGTVVTVYVSADVDFSTVLAGS